jgi:hypothetical protein
MSGLLESASDTRPTPELAAASQAFFRDLPGLLKTKLGRWVVYTQQGQVAEGTDELALFREFAHRGMTPDQFLVARVEPDAPVADVSDSWFPPSSADNSPA